VSVTYPFWNAQRVEADGTMVVRRGAQQVNALVPPQRG